MVFKMYSYYMYLSVNLFAYDDISEIFPKHMDLFCFKGCLVGENKMAA